jgi:hypothetical protein
VPLPTSYTETTLQGWIVTELGNVAALLGWTDTHPQVIAAVADAEGLLGVADVALSADPRKVERVAAVAAWRCAVKNLSALYTVLEDQQQHNRSDLQKQAQAALSLAEREAAHDLGALQIAVVRRRYLGDPYSYLPEEARIP